MEIVVFILLAGVWAAFVLPWFFEQRSAAPAAATRDFARSKELLASVSTPEGQARLIARRRLQARRRRTLASLGGGALFTLFVAVVTGAVVWLVLSIVFDLAIGAFVTSVLAVEQRRGLTRERVVAMPVPPPLPETPPAPDETIPTVRIIAG